MLGRFLHLEQKTREDADGNRVTKETLIFPRYHQWEVVNTLIETTRAEGPGKRYLIQHSAGSGKSNSIAWMRISEHRDRPFRLIVTGHFASA